jgi:hypothetical protein
MIKTSNNLNGLKSAMFRYVTLAVTIFSSPITRAQVAISNIQVAQRSGSVVIAFKFDTTRTFLSPT